MIQSCFQMYYHASLTYSMILNDYHIHIFIHLILPTYKHGITIVAVSQKRICIACSLRSQDCYKWIHLKVDQFQSLHQPFMKYSNEYVVWMVESCLSLSFSHQHLLYLQDLTVPPTSFFSEKEKLRWNWK